MISEVGCVERRLGTAMALIKFQFPISNCHLPLPRLKITDLSGLSISRRMSEGFALKSPLLPTPLSKTRGLCIPNNDSLLMRGTKSHTKKPVGVFSPNISMDAPADFLDAYDDEYDGVIIDPECLPSSANAFSSILRSSLAFWKLKGKKGVWLKILPTQADLIPIAVKEGFVYHHAEPGYVMLTYWLPEEPCMLPATGSHQVGIGGFVINENKEILVVKEKKCPLRCSGVWKLPTGFIDKSEEIYMGAIREVKEETGIDTEFVEVVAFRHAHFVSFEKSDLFFICMLKPLSTQITIDGGEIQDAKWMPLEELLSQPFYQEDFMSKKAIDICIARREHCYRGFSAHQVMSKFDDRVSHLYYGDLPPIALTSKC